MNINSELFKFIKNSPTAYHTVDTVKNMLLENGFSELSESQEWTLSDGGKYFVTRNGSSLIAFVANSESGGFMISASHSDSPAFHVKATGKKLGAYTRLDVEKYGGMIYYSWLDRPLSIAGRVIIRTPVGIKTALVNIDKDIAVIPSVAIHLNRGVNEGYKFNPAVDLIPLVSLHGAEDITVSCISEKLGVDKDDIIDSDLFLYNRDEGKMIGFNEDFILSPRLDDLECVFASYEGFVEANPKASIPVLSVFDNEEVGSSTKQGAASTFLKDVLWRIAGSEESYLRMLANSFMISADNAHAKHPNHPELSDAENAPVLNGGVVIKRNANQRYTTDGVSAAVFSLLCERCGVKTQTYYNRADIPGGSTLGSISNTVVSVPTIDIGLAQLAMHSANETAGAEDLGMLVRVLEEFFSSSVKNENGNIEIVR